MNSPSAPTRVLLDKNIVRAAISGLRFGERRPLLPVEFSALSFWRAAETLGSPIELFIPYTTTHILTPLSSYAEVRLLLDATLTLAPGRYTRRWQRRVCETTGLTPEDSMILALGTFGTNAAGTILGAHLVVTADQRLLNGYHRWSEQLRRRLHRMCAQLATPFDQVVLPRALLPEDAMAELRV